MAAARLFRLRYDIEPRKRQVEKGVFERNERLGRNEQFFDIGRTALAARRSPLTGGAGSFALVGHIVYARLLRDYIIT
jgi:hypothetical protein